MKDEHESRALEGNVRTADGRTLEAVVGLVNSVMRRDVPPERGMQRRFPWVFSLANARNVYFVADAAGRPISTASLALGEVVTGGVRLGVASIGSVATAPEARGHGWATAVLRKILSDLEERHVALALISGDRFLYRRLGFVEAGGLDRVQWRVPAEPRETRRSRGRVLQVDRPEGLAAALHALYHAEPVRFARSVRDMQVRLEALPFARPGRRHSVFVALRGTEILAYAVTTVRDDDPGRLHLMEWAGSRLALWELLPEACQTTGCFEVVFFGQPDDVTLRDLCVQSGASIQRVFNHGTMRVVDASRLLESDLQPLCRERGLRFEVTAQAGNLTMTSFDESTEGVAQARTWSDLASLTTWVCSLAPWPQAFGLELPCTTGLDYV